MKYKGVYLLTFDSVRAAEEFLSTDIAFNNEPLTTTKLSQYKREKFFQRQIQRCKVIENKHQRDMSQLKDLKRSGKLDNCVSVQISSADISDDQVQEYFCGVSSEFIDKFGKPVEEARKLTEENKKSFVEYILVFEVEEDAKSFASNPEVHKFGSLNLRVLLLTDSMKRIRFSRKPKNFVDDKQFTEFDHSRRVAVQTVDKLKSEEEVRIFFKDHFSNLKHIHRCEINDNFLGLYILTFPDEMSAKTAASVNLEKLDVVKNTMITPLDQYIRCREKYLSTEKKARNPAINSSSWKVDFQDLEKVHQEHWGNIETEYKSIYDRIEQETSPRVSRKQAKVVHKKSQQVFDIGFLEVFVGCEDFGLIDERSRLEIEEYFYDNHENVVSVHFTSLVFVKFTDLASADRFFTLSYIRYRGRKIVPLL